MVSGVYRIPLPLTLAPRTPDLCYDAPNAGPEVRPTSKRLYALPQARKCLLLQVLDANRHGDAHRSSAASERTRHGDWDGPHGQPVPAQLGTARRVRLGALENSGSAVVRLGTSGGPALSRSRRGRSAKEPAERATHSGRRGRHLGQHQEDGEEEPDPRWASARFLHARTSERIPNPP